MKMYGIANCDTVRKARKFLENNRIDFSFHDFRKDGLTLEKIQQWLEKQPIETLVNKRSTSWKQLSEAQKNALMEKRDLSPLIETPTLVKRPVLEADSFLMIGFKEQDYQALIKR